MQVKVKWYKALTVRASLHSPGEKVVYVQLFLGHRKDQIHRVLLHLRRLYIKF